MGDVTHIVVTGATGFLGRQIVRQGLAAGHRLTAISRKAPDTDLGCKHLPMNLAKVDRGELMQQIAGADAIIHAAGEMSSDLAVHARSTLPATRTICKVAEKLDLHLVHVSSIAIYDYLAVGEGEFVTEATRAETKPETRDGYVAAKLDQEHLVASFCPSASVLRVGALFGPGRVWNAHLGTRIGPALIRLAPNGQIPLCHVTRAAAAALQAATRKISGAVNVVDADLPDRIRFLDAFEKSGWPRIIIPFPWQAMDRISGALGFWKSRPGLLRRPVLHARIKPVGFDSSLLSASFPDLPNMQFESAMREALKHG
ncbi:MAG: NAD(P)-dependent oxidoreductase [Pseudomonadota bacterium]